MSLESSLQRIDELTAMVGGSTTAAQAQPAPGQQGAFAAQLAQASGTDGTTALGAGAADQQAAALRARVASAGASIGAIPDDGSDSGDGSTIDVYGGMAGSTTPALGSSSGAYASPYGATPYGTSAVVGASP